MWLLRACEGQGAMAKWIQLEPPLILIIPLFDPVLFAFLFLYQPPSPVGKESACNAGDLGSIPGSEISPGEGNGNPLQYSCRKNPMDRGAWQAPVHGVARLGHDWAHCLSVCFSVFPSRKVGRLISSLIKVGCLILNQAYFRNILYLLNASVMMKKRIIARKKKSYQMYFSILCSLTFFKLFTLYCLS